MSTAIVKLTLAAAALSMLTVLQGCGSNGMDESDIDTVTLDDTAPAASAETSTPTPAATADGAAAK